MKRDDSRFNAKAQEEKDKRSGLAAAGQMRRGGVKVRELGTTASLYKQSETKKQTANVRMRHDDVEQSRLPALPLFVVKRHQSVGGERHYFPCDQEQEGVGGCKDNGQVEKEEVEQETKETNVPLALEFFQIAE
jgi:hypothetical protein